MIDGGKNLVGTMEVIRDIVVAGAAIWTAMAAISGVDAWKRQMTGDRKYRASCGV